MSDLCSHCSKPVYHTPCISGKKMGQMIARDLNTGKWHTCVVPGGPRPWTDEEKRIVMTGYGPKTARQLALEVNRSVTSVKKLIERETNRIIVKR